MLIGSEGTGEQRRREEDGAGAPRADEQGPAPAAKLGSPPSYGLPTFSPRGELVLHPPRRLYRDLMSAMLRDGFEMVSDLCGVDYLAHPTRALPEGVRPERFEVVVSVISLQRRQRVRVRVQVPDHDPVLPTLFDLYPGSDAMEREAYDMFGIRFEGHPDLTRILMPEDWEGFPLRKDYSVGRVPVQFKEAPGPR
jgi:NADH-quinone oxidoreductase subunit C